MRTQEEFVSKLPRYQAKRSEQFSGFLIVYCGRKDCPGTKADRPFLVAEREWLRPYRVVSRTGKVTVIFGRACPYCFKAGRLPTRAEISRGSPE